MGSSLDRRTQEDTHKYVDDKRRTHARGWPFNGHLQSIILYLRACGICDMCICVSPATTSLTARRTDNIRACVCAPSRLYVHIYILYRTFIYVKPVYSCGKLIENEPKKILELILYLIFLINSQNVKNVFRS